jgi:hypothetical protein
VNAAAVPPVPEVDIGRISRLRHVLAGGNLALEADRQLAAEILRHFPRTRYFVQATDAFHARAARWAVTGGTPEFPVPEAAGVIFGDCDYPVPGGFHAGAQAVRSGALFAYASADAEATAFNQALLALPDQAHVSAYQGQALDPAGLLGAPEAQAILLRGPVQVQLQLCVHWWPPEFAAWAVGEYARLLPSGSTLALSCGFPGSSGGAAAFTAAISRGDVSGMIYHHAEDEIAAWIKAAGLELTPTGITDVRGRELDWAAAEFTRQRPVATVIEAVALVP